MSSKIKNLKCYERMEITLAEFLYLYCGLADQRFFDITHEDVKTLIPELKRTSFKRTFANSELVYMGDIILVRDCKGNTVPYVSPFKNSEFEVIEVKKMLIKERKVKEEEIPDIKTMPNYKLRIMFRLQKNSKLKGKYKTCRLIKRELEERGIEKLGRKKAKLERIRFYYRRKEYD